MSTFLLILLHVESSLDYRSWGSNRIWKYIVIAIRTAVKKNESLLRTGSLTQWLTDLQRLLQFNVRRTLHLLCTGIWCMQENDSCVQGEVAALVEKDVIIQVFSYGGFIPSTFQPQQVFIIERFARIILTKNTDLFFSVSWELIHYSESSVV